MMAILGFVMFLAAAAVALAAIAMTLAGSAERIGQVFGAATGRPEGMPPLPPRRQALRRVTVTRVAAEDWRAAA